MPFINLVIIKNFKCYRQETKFDLSKSTYLVGANNSGKSAVLNAIHCFFNDSMFNDSFINKFEFRARQEGFNRSEISIGFNLEEITLNKTRLRYIKRFGKDVVVKKSFIFREATGKIDVIYTFKGKELEFQNLDLDIVKLIKSVNISYIHPQKADELLQRAQEKLKDRLLANFGRNPSIAEVLNELKDSWTKMSEKANKYLSNALTQSLQGIWPECETRIELPKSIEELIKISDISFRSSITNPIVELTNQGTGAQSTILYETHYILDSDRSLHQGLYNAIWLIEEPESFLHADLCIKLGLLLNSTEWLKNIQMVITTHNGYILGSASKNKNDIYMYLIEKNQIKKSSCLSDWSDDEIRDIGKNLGDPYFMILFHVLSDDKRIFIEDTREQTKKAFEKIGINIYKPLAGVTEIKKYLEVADGLNINLPAEIFFIVDSDDGLKQLSDIVRTKKKEAVGTDGVHRILIRDKVVVISLPENYAVENLYAEYDQYLETQVSLLFDKDSNYSRASKKSIPAALTRVHGAIRSKTNNQGMPGAKDIIRNIQDIKDQFWVIVEKNKLEISPKYKQALIDALRM